MSSAELDRRLADWVSGRTRTTTRFTLGYATNLPLNAGNEAWNPNDPNSAGDYQGYLVGTEVVDQHVIAYVGFEDARGAQYFVPFNVGNLGRAQDQCAIAQNGTSMQVMSSNVVFVAWMPGCYRYLQASVGYVISLSTFGRAFIAANLPIDESQSGPTPSDYVAQGGIADTLVAWSAQVARHRGYREASLPAGVAALVNRRVHQFVPSTIPMATNLMRYGDVLTGSPVALPFTVSGTNYDVSDLFALAKGSYRVTYTATGACAGFTGRLLGFGNDLSVPVATGAPASDGSRLPTIAVLAAETGRYYIAAGVPGCSWSFTITSP